MRDVRSVPDDRPVDASQVSLQDRYGFEGVAIVRASFGSDALRAAAFYAPILQFVQGLQGPPARLIDVGCGVGWSTFAFADAGYDTLGIDLNPNAFEPPRHERLDLRMGSAEAIPYPDASFDIIVCYQCLEHVPSPERALREMMRVCRPGGTIAVVGPNLVSPTVGLTYALRPSNWRTRRFIRRPGMSRHPYGRTLPEMFAVAAWRSLQLAYKLLRPSPHFSMREPDLRPPFHADNDACYLCNPTDLIKYFRKQNCTILRRGKPGRPPMTYLFAGGTWVAARKPDAY